MKRAVLSMAIFFLVVCHSNVSWANAVDPIVQVDRPYIMANEKRPVYVLVRFNVAKVKEDPSKPRPKLNLALVLDRSGSMADRGKLEYAKKSAEQGDVPEEKQTALLSVQKRKTRKIYS